MQFTFSDLPANDFNTLINVVTSSKDLSTENNVFALAQGQNFYSSCAAPSSVHLCLSMITLHWLSKVPPVFDQGIKVHQYEMTHETKVSWKKYQHRDLVSFLQLRAQELVSGGEAIFLMVGGDGIQQWALDMPTGTKYNSAYLDNINDS